MYCNAFIPTAIRCAKRCLATAFLISLPFGSALQAESAAQSVAVVDMQRVINESIIGKAAKTNLESEVKKREGSLEKLKNDVASMRAELEKQVSVLSGAALDEKKGALERKEREFSRLLQDQREELAKKNRIEIGRVVEEIQKVIKGLADDQGYDLVLEKGDRTILYSSAKFDITGKVVEKLDATKFKS